MDPSSTMKNRRMILLLSAMLLQSFCFLSASGQDEPGVTFDFKRGNNSTLSTTIGNSSNPTGYSPFQLSSYLVSGNVNTLKMITKYTANKTGPFCYLEVVPRLFGMLNNVSSGTTIPWTKPCPRRPLQVPQSGFWCTFEFAADGNLVLKSGARDVLLADGAVLWSSNTSGLGAQTLELLDDSGDLLGNLALYDANRTVVWRNVADNPAFESFSCTDPAPALAPAAAPTETPPAPANDNAAYPSFASSSAFTVISAMAALTFTLL